MIIESARSVEGMGRGDTHTHTDTRTLESVCWCARTVERSGEKSGREDGSNKERGK